MSTLSQDFKIGSQIECWGNQKKCYDSTRMLLNLGNLFSFNRMLSEMQFMLLECLTGSVVVLSSRESL